jgi:hypothetical protein
MKRFIGLAAFVALLSAPAHAQNKAIGVSSSNPITGSSYSGGGGGGGGLGSSSSGRLPRYPPAQFAVNAVSGTEEAYNPSTFLSYDQAIAAGKAANAGTKSLAETAVENSNTQKAKAKVAFVQDADGNVVAIPR